MVRTVVLLGAVLSPLGWCAGRCEITARDTYGLDRAWAVSHESASPMRGDGKLEVNVSIARVGVFTLVRFDKDSSLFVMDSKRVFQRWSALSLSNRSVLDALKVYLWFYERSTEQELWSRYAREPITQTELNQAIAALPTQWPMCQLTKLNDTPEHQLAKDRRNFLDSLIKMHVLFFLYSNGYEGVTSLLLRAKREITAEAGDVDIDIEFSHEVKRKVVKVSVHLNPNIAPFVGPIEFRDGPMVRLP